MSSREHQPLQASFLVAALAIALTTGFASAVALGLALGGVVPIGPWWPGVVQAHGQAQLFGFMALFVLGVGFYFLPRMRGAPLARQALVPWIVRLVASGVITRFAGQTGLALGGPSAFRVLLALSAPLLGTGAVFTLVVLASTLRNGPPIRTRAGVLRVLPFMGLAFLSFVTASVFSAALALDAAWSGAATLDSRGSAVAVALMLHGFAVPIAFAVSVQTLPLFLRLPAPTTPLTHAMGVAYTIGLLARVAGIALSLERLESVGAAGGAIITIAFVLSLDVVTRFRAPWTAARLPYRLGSRAPARAGMPDRGEFGRFEWLVRGAYGWLLVAAGLQLASLAGLTTADAPRHAVTVGFITLLIAGMAIRMLPGFAKRPLRHPRAVAPVAILGNATAFCRVAPLVFPSMPGAEAALAASGLLGLILVTSLALLLGPLLLRNEQPQSRP